MNVERIYSLQRDEAFADLFEATEYKTFVAMPFSSRGGYPSHQIIPITLRNETLARIASVYLIR
jgi:hypothetical protein